MLKRAFAYAQEIKNEIQDRRSLAADYSPERTLGHPDHIYSPAEAAIPPELENPDDEEAED
jgi:hypothetical protein